MKKKTIAEAPGSMQRIKQGQMAAAGLTGTAGAPTAAAPAPAPTAAAAPASPEDIKAKQIATAIQNMSPQDRITAIQLLQSKSSATANAAATATVPAAPASPITTAAQPKFRSADEIVDAVLKSAPLEWLPTITASLLKKQQVSGNKR